LCDHYPAGFPENSSERAAAGGFKRNFLILILN
jgi:hypothetical protein